MLFYLETLYTEKKTNPILNEIMRMHLCYAKLQKVCHNQQPKKQHKCNVNTKKPMHTQQTRPDTKTEKYTKEKTTPHPTDAGSGVAL